jgi:cytochrome P450
VCNRNSGTEINASCVYFWSQGKRNVEQKLTQLLKHRLSTPEKKHGDLLDLLVEELRSEKPLIDEVFAIDTLSGLLFGSFVTISGTLTVGLKLLKDNPEVVETLKVVICSMFQIYLISSTR